MQFHKHIDKKIIHILNGKEYRFFRHLFPLLMIGVIILEMIYKNSDGYYYEYGLLYQFIGSYLLFIGVIYFNLYLLVPRFLLNGRLFAYVTLFAISVLFTLFAFVVVQHIFSYSHEDRAIPEIGVNITGTLISIALIIIASSAFPLFRNWIEYNKRIGELETATIEIELQQLKNQINPHFLFNTINNANIKVGKDGKQACHILTKLSELLRYQLIETSQNTVLLKDNIAFLTDYLELEKTRRDRFYYKLETDKSIQDIKIPPLLFIPFVENAVKHSISVKEEAYIRIFLRVEKGYLHFYCENTKPINPPKHKSGGLGLKNSKRRLELLYARNHVLDINESGNKYIVNLYLKI